MLRRILILTICSLFLWQTAAFAQEENEPFPFGDLVCERWPQGIVVTNYTGDGGDVVVPGSIEGETVYAIASEAFQFESLLTSIVLPESIQAIGHSAFKGCDRLEKIVWPDSLYGIGVQTFSGCASLKEVILPENVGYISSEAFAGCTGLERILLPERTYDLAGGAFRDCVNLRIVEILGDPTSGAVADEDRPFAGCENIEQVFYGGDEEALQALIPPAQLTWADSFLLVPNHGNDSVILETYLGDGGDIAVPRMIGDRRVSGFGPNLFTHVSQLGRILFDGTDAQWQELDLGIGNESAFEHVLCLGSADEKPVLELKWEDGLITGASFGSLDGVPLQCSSIGNAFADPWCTFRYTSLAGERLRSFDLLTTGAQVSRFDGSGSEDALVVLAGDVLGSGVLNIAQLVRMAGALTGTDDLNGPFLAAADLNENGIVDITDLVTEAGWLAEYSG